MLIHEPFEKSIGIRKKATAKLILEATLLERLQKDPRASADVFAYRLLRRMDVRNIEISLRTV